MFMSDLDMGLFPALIGMFIIQILFTLGVVYYIIVKRYVEQEEILLTSLLLVALVIEELVNHQYPVTAGVNIPTTILSGATKVGAATIPNQMFIVAALSAIITAAFVVFLLKTRWGYIIRAVSQSTRSARLMGVKVEWVYAVALVLSIIPPTVCILVISPIWSIEPYLGTPFLQTAILVSILGGLGNLRGTVIASFIVGLVSSSVAFLINPRLVGLAILVMVFFVLVLRPEGIARSESLW
jgi:branched-chain amino acid transport system permease protein